MSLYNFSNVQYVKSIDTGELIRCGSFKVSQNAELAYVRPLIYVQGILGGNERLRARFYSDENHSASKLLFTSKWTPKLSTAFSEWWLGFIAIEFGGENLNPNIPYYVEIELDGYTRNGEVFYIGVCRDFPYPIYKITPTPQRFYQHPQALQIFNRIER